MSSTIQFKRGTAARWAELNMVLAVGEPGFELDTGKLKIGDGETPWMDLSYVGDTGVISKSSYFEFESFGKTNTVYKDESTGKLYIYEDGRYKVLDMKDVLDITFINGGNASGTT